MQIVLDISKEDFTRLKDAFESGDWEQMRHAEIVGAELLFRSGTPLPKGHGKLIDADVLIKSIEKKAERLKNLDTINGLCGAINLIYETNAIIEAVRAENEVDEHETCD